MSGCPPLTGHDLARSVHVVSSAGTCRLDIHAVHCSPEIMMANSCIWCLVCSALDLIKQGCTIRQEMMDMYLRLDSAIALRCFGFAEKALHAYQAWLAYGGILASTAAAQASITAYEKAGLYARVSPPFPAVYSGPSSLHATAGVDLTCTGIICAGTMPPISLTGLPDRCKLHLALPYYRIVLASECFPKLRPAFPVASPGLCVLSRSFHGNCWRRGACSF